MNAIIYAAGRACRLGPHARGIPKILLPIGGLSLLERHVQILAHLQIPHLSIVTGYENRQVQEVLPTLSSRYQVEIAEIHNPNFTEGSALSMHCSLPALSQTGDHILLMDGDVLYDARLLRRLLESPHPTALLIDRHYSTADDDPVLVPLRQGKPFEFVKKWQGQADGVGESIGFFKVHRQDFPLLAEQTERRTAGLGRQDSYDEILRALVQAGRFAAEDVTGLPWTEIDFPEDLDYARDVILPRLQAPPAP